jgi:hypothetical protein
LAAAWSSESFGEVTMDDRYKIEMWDGEKPDPMVHPYDRACIDVRTQLFEHDAREWFNTESPLPKSIHEFSTTESEQIVDEIYARGADSVFVLGDEDTIQRGGSIDMLLIELPMDRHSRAQLYDLNQMVAEETGFDGDIDEGQRFMLLRWT